MKIEQIQNNFIDFNGRLPNIKINDTRQIPHLKCAICGKEMLTFNEFQATLNKTLLGANKFLKSKELESYQSQNVFAMLVDLAKHHPKTPISILIQDPKFQKNIKKLSIQEQKTLNDIIELSKTKTKNSKQVIKQLLKLQPLFDKNMQEVISILEVYSLRYPDQTFSEILHKPEIIKYHKENVKIESLKYKTLQNKAQRNFLSIAKHLHLEELHNFNTLYTNILKIITIPHSTNQVRFEMLLNTFEKYKRVATNLDPKILKKISTAIQKFPIENFSTSQKILSMVSKNDANIIENLLSYLQVSFEHVIPKSRQGSKDKGNGICLHMICNKNRGVLPYTLINRIYPDFQSNLQKQINTVISYIKGGRLLTYEEYPQQIKKTMLYATHQNIRINIKKYLKYQAQKAKQKLEKEQQNLTLRSEKLEKTKQEINQAEVLLNQLKEKIQLLRQKEHNDIIKYKQAKTNCFNMKNEYQKTLKAIKKDK